MVTKWAVRIPDKVTNRNWTSQIVFIVPAPFCATKCVSHARYRVGERIPVQGRRLRPHDNNAVFEQVFCPNNPPKYGDHSILTLKTLRNICTGEKFYSD